MTVIAEAKSSKITAYVLWTLLFPRRHRAEGVGSVRRKPSLPGRRHESGMWTRTSGRQNKGARTSVRGIFQVAQTGLASWGERESKHLGSLVGGALAKPRHWRTSSEVSGWMGQETAWRGQKRHVAHLVFTAVCWMWLVSWEGEEMRGALQVPRTLGHGNCPANANLHVSITSAPSLPLGWGAGGSCGTQTLTWWLTAWVSGDSVDHMAVPSPNAAPLMPQFPHLHSRGDHRFCHIQKKQGSDVIMYEMSFTQWLGHRKEFSKPSWLLLLLWSFLQMLHLSNGQICFFTVGTCQGLFWRTLSIRDSLMFYDILPHFMVVIYDKTGMT